MRFFTFINLLTIVRSQFNNGDVLIGGSRDTNNCLINAGFSWCEASQECLRIWETPCKDNYSDCNDCLERQRNGENIACPTTCDNVVINGLIYKPSLARITAF